MNQTIGFCYAKIKTTQEMSLYWDQCGSSYNINQQRNSFEQIKTRPLIEEIVDKIVQLKVNWKCVQLVEKEMIQSGKFME